MGYIRAGIAVGPHTPGFVADASLAAPMAEIGVILLMFGVGMHFHPMSMFEQPLLLLGALGVVLLVKPLVAVAIVLLLRDSLRTALTVAVGLAQIGEFSFILAALGMQVGVLPEAGMDLLVAAAIVSIGLNPLLFRAQRAWERRVPAREAPAPAPQAPAGAPVVSAGASAVGRRLIERCAKVGLALNVVTQDLDALEELRERGIGATYGEPGNAEVLRAAGLAQAKMIVVVAPSLMDKMRICGAARAANPRIAIVATSVGEAERAWLQEFGVAFTCDPLDEASDALLRAIHAGL